MLHSGIDLHKRTVVIATVDATRWRVREAQLPITRALLSTYFASLPGGAELLREDPSQADQGWQSLPEVRIPSRRSARDPVLPRDPRLGPGAPSTEARAGSSPGDSRSAREPGVAQPSSAASASPSASFSDWAS